MAYFIGLMSGTSLDGVDTAICSIDSPCEFSLIDAHTYPIPETLKQTLLTLSQESHADELLLYAELDVQMGHLFADCCVQILQKNQLNPVQISAIGSHGQTLRHFPDSQFPTTLQIGDANIIAHETSITTIADFRRRDMAAGGQGAPLVPPFHQALFSDPQKQMNRVVLNIGGIANITILPADSGTVLGYDTGPGNGLMDDWCCKHFDCDYDASGKLAAQGKVDKDFLDLMLGDTFFSQKSPKSTGREYFSYAWLEQQLATYTNEVSAIDVLSTLLELTCQSICNEILALANPVNGQIKTDIDEVFVCGGGVRNTLLMQRLQDLLPDMTVESTEKLGLHPDWVEASAFAWLAHQTMNSLTGNLPSVTGASKSVILGAIWQA
ncbi:anhydro-N-acetylmuramic acid kinase [sulfur-oxidizing endosymbiont of Gigantopelta aegis]|uniref:anhydro-N-acetylmuramic acid kinase n=1 Tax=sulfur-oxidizing endosymbiont of Gigantopelta aegis TaxID=2794934 RepID=UPI0018DDE7BB|nr:anhydro-N-acetylmuramic acid kinase [sulfur-oxidizing endosymbiont of Gigantopelta aegis]